MLPLSFEMNNSLKMATILGRNDVAKSYISILGRFSPLNEKHCTFFFVQYLPVSFLLHCQLADDQPLYFKVFLTGFHLLVLIAYYFGATTFTEKKIVHIRLHFAYWAPYWGSLQGFQTIASFRALLKVAVALKEWSAFRLVPVCIAGSRHSSFYQH